MDIWVEAKSWVCMQYLLLICWPVGAFSGGSGSHVSCMDLSWRVHLQTMLLFKLRVALVLFPTMSTYNICLLSQSRLPFLLKVSVFFSSPLNLSAFVLKASLTSGVIGVGLQTALNQLEYKDPWVSGKVILFPENSFVDVKNFVFLKLFPDTVDKLYQGWFMISSWLTYYILGLQVKVKVVKPIRKSISCIRYLP